MTEKLAERTKAQAFFAEWIDKKHDELLDACQAADLNQVTLTAKGELIVRLPNWAFEMMEEFAQSQWIKITDDPKTLPKNDGLYLVMWGSDRAIFRYDTDNQPCWVDISGNVYYSISGYDEDYEPEIRVTHWMPLPAPPAAEQTEE